MIHLIAITLIERPVDQVFDFISTPENDYRWQYGTLAAAAFSERRDRMRTFFRSIGHLMGRRNLGTFEITQFETDKTYGFRSLSGPVHSTTSYHLENLGGRTRISISIRASIPNFFHITEKLLSKTMEIQLDEDVARLKKILEEPPIAFRSQPVEI